MLIYFWSTFSVKCFFAKNFLSSMRKLVCNSIESFQELAYPKYRSEILSVWWLGPVLCFSIKKKQKLFLKENVTLSATAHKSRPCFNLMCQKMAHLFIMTLIYSEEFFVREAQLL